MVEVVQMSLKETDRYAVIQQVIGRTMRQSDAALWLNISVRQVKRLVRTIRQDGAQGAVSKRWGVPSNRRMPAAVHDQMMALVHQHYSDFGPTLAHEYLKAQHGYNGSAETLRTWMIAAGLWKAKRTRVRRIHSPRARRNCAGELVQIDGSPHAWFEDRAPKCCLIVFIDDVLKRKENLTGTQRIRLRDILKYNLQTVRAYLLKEQFQQFWDYDSPTWAGKILDQWIALVMRSRIEPMKKVAKTLRSHRKLILNYFRAKKQFSSGVLMKQISIDIVGPSNREAMP